MTAELQTIHSIDEFRRLYYPEPDPELEYFDGHEPEDAPEDENDGAVVQDPLDRFRRLMLQDDRLIAREL